MLGNVRGRSLFKHHPTYLQPNKDRFSKDYTSKNLKRARKSKRRFGTLQITSSFASREKSC
jgi:hypothetical protein